MTIDGGSDVIGVALLVLGVFLMLRFRKARFDRTNAFGVQQFSSYWAKIGAKTKGAVLRGLSILLLCSGLVVLAFNRVDSLGWILVLPVLVFMLFLLSGL